MTRLCVRGARVIDPSQGLDEPLDLLVEEGRVLALEKPGTAVEGATDLAGEGLLLLPGLVDLHTHLREPGHEHKETIATGSRAAAAGGFTSICSMANTQPPNDQAHTTRFVVEEAARAGAARVLPIGAVSRRLEGKALAEMAGMAEAGAVAFSDDGLAVSDSGLMRKALEYARPLGRSIVVHEEDPGLSARFDMNEGVVATRLGLRGQPAEAEEILLARDLMLLRLTRSRLHVAHVSTAGSVEMIRRAKDEGLAVTAEVTPHHLFLDETLLLERRYDPLLKMAPPLRTLSDLQALRAGLKDGSLDCIATDHAPHSQVEKEGGFHDCAKGVVGLGSALGLTLKLVQEGVLDWATGVASMTHRAARCFDLEAGSLGVGRPADFVLVDPRATQVVQPSPAMGTSHNSPFLGWELPGRVHQTWVGGVCVFEAD